MIQKTKYTYENFAKLSLEQRKKLYLELKAKKPTFIPTILIKFAKSQLPELSQCRVILPENHLVLQFKRDVLALLSKKRAMEKQTLVLVNNNKIMQGATTLKEVYDKSNANKADSDGWFYVVYSNAQTF